MALRSKLPHIGTTIFTVMSALANEHKAINLSQGFPNYDCDVRIKNLVSHHMQIGNNQYAPMAGLIELREALSMKTKKLYGKEYDPDTEITITAGATQAIFTAITAFIHTNDEVIIFTPSYDCYEPAITLAGGQTRYVPLDPDDFSLNLETLKKVMSERTRMIILNSPHNPSGTMISAETMTELERLLDGKDIIVLSDEVYEHIIFDGQVHQSVSRYPGLSERSIVVSSFGKTYHNTGWKVGHCAAPRELMDEFRKVHQFNVFCVNRPVQHAFHEILGMEELFLELGEFYQAKRDLFFEAVSSSRFTAAPCEGTYFQLLDYRAISEETDVDLAHRLTIEKGIASIPISVFNYPENDKRYLRFCFAKNEDTLLRAAEKICAI